jgi:hypothetical protein
MKKFSLYLLIFIFAVSCGKIKYRKQQFDLNEITQTDTSGNITGNINPNDWVFKPVSEASEFDKKAFSKAYESFSNGPDFSNRAPQYPANFDNTNCGNISLKLLAYPNPVQSIGSVEDCTLNIKLEASLQPFDRFFVFSITKSGSELGYNFIASTYDRIDNQLGIYLPPTKERDYIVYYLISTKEGCLYYTKGNVIGCEK